MNLLIRYKMLTFWNKVGFWGAVASLLAIPISLFLHFTEKRTIESAPEKVASVYTQPFSLEFKDDYFEVYSRFKNTLWSQKVSGTISSGKIVDLNDDGDQEVIIGVRNSGKDTGKIITFGLNGNVIWTYDTTVPFNYSGGRSDRLAVEGFEVADLFETGHKQIIIHSRDAQGWYQSLLSVIDSDGSLLSSYWHPGHIQKLTIGSKEVGMDKMIVVGAANNDLRSRFSGEGNIYTLFMVDPKHVFGEAPPYYGRSKKGSEIWYGIITPKNEGIHRLEILDRDDDGHNEICLWTSKGNIFYIDFSGKVVGRGFSNGATGNAEFMLLKEAK